MKLNKKSFLKTEVGSELDNCIKVWDNALEERKKATPGFPEYEAEGLGLDYWEKTCAYCQAQWEVYQMVILQFFGVEYHFTRTTEYFGLVTEDESDWLIKYDRKDV
mgnify:CR=1 FL=1